ncbi:MAG: hypothetical protein ACLFRP_09170 [Puniceicoccaceae bacterium]
MKSARKRGSRGGVHLPATPGRRGWFSRLGLPIASLIGWFLALGAFQGYLDFRGLLRADNEWFRDGLVFVNPTVRPSDSVGLTRVAIRPATLEAIRAAPGVSVAEPVLRNRYPLAIRVGGGPVPSLTSEIFVEALGPGVLADQAPDWGWAPDDPAVPVLVPRQFLNLYNFGFAPGKGLPPVSEATAARVPFSLVAFPGGEDPPESFPGKIVGFSGRIESILVPVSFLEWTNRRYADPERRSEFGRVAVVARDSRSPEFLSLLAEHRLEVGGDRAGAGRLRMLLDLVLAALGTAGGVILVLTLLLLRVEAEELLSGNRDRIRKLYFLGHPPSALLPPLLRAQAVLALPPAVLGLGLVWLVRLAVARSLEEGGLSLSSAPAAATVLFWTVLVLSAAGWLTLRLRDRLRNLYE